MEQVKITKKEKGRLLEQMREAHHISEMESKENMRIPGNERDNK
jgi:hypothetical protein